MYKENVSRTDVARSDPTGPGRWRCLFDRSSPLASFGVLVRAGGASQTGPGPAGPAGHARTSHRHDGAWRSHTLTGQLLRLQLATRRTGRPVCAMEKLHSRGHTAHLPTARAHRKKQLTAKGEREPNARRRRICAGCLPFLVPVGFITAATMRGMDTLQPNAPGAAPVGGARLWPVVAAGCCELAATS